MGIVLIGRDFFIVKMPLNTASADNNLYEIPKVFQIALHFCDSMIFC